MDEAWWTASYVELSDEGTFAKYISKSLPLRLSKSSVVTPSRQVPKALFSIFSRGLHSQLASPELWAKICRGVIGLLLMEGYRSTPLFSAEGGLPAATSHH